MSMLADKSNNVRSKAVDAIGDDAKFGNKSVRNFVAPQLNFEATLISEACVMSQFLQPARHLMKSCRGVKRNLK